MRRLAPILLLSLPLAFLPACRNAAPVREAEASRTAYEDSVYCFNGCYVVTLDGRRGLVGEGGTLIYRPDWDSIEFIDDDVALLRRSGICYLGTRDGRLFAESASQEELEGSFRDRFAAMQEADYLSWTRVLDRLDSLCDACLSAKIHPDDGRLLRERALLQDCLSKVSGRPGPEQKARLEQIERKFSSSYR